MTNKQTMLAALRAGGSAGVTTAELMRVGCGSRYGARLLELRAEGFEISSERVRDGSWRYTLIGERVEPKQIYSQVEAEIEQLFTTPPTVRSAIYGSDD